MIVIGSGMMADAFKSSGMDIDGVLIFCSGVSNSHESSDVEFLRERNTLYKAQDMYPDKKIVYFSSCAIGILDNPYYRHKLNMECFVKETFAQYLICRLPQVVGNAHNATFVNFIVKSIKERTQITVYNNATRNLIDIDDVIRFTVMFSKLDSMTINITNGNMISIIEIIKFIAAELGIEPLTEIGPAEVANGVYDGALLSRLISREDPIYSQYYQQNVLKKYLLQYR